MPVIPGAHQRGRSVSAAILSKRKLRRSAARGALVIDVYYQQSKESDVGSLAHAQQSSQRLLQLLAGNKIIWIGFARWSLSTVRSIDAIYSARGSWARPFVQAQSECSPAYLIVLFTSNKLLFAAVLRANKATAFFVCC